jgi:MoaA/NifB/PqqE/SkfB family radical SAM enzyme
LKRLLIKFKSNGLRGVEITGGEPTLHPDFFEIVDFCSEQFDLVGILTNGYLIDENAVGKLSCYKEKIVMSVSLDGSTAEKHDSFRGIRSFDKVTRAIKLLSDSGIFVRATMSVSPENFGDIENTLLLAKKLGARVFGYSPIIPFGRGKDIAPYEITPEKAKEMTEMDLYIKRTYPDFLQTIPEGYLKEQLKNQPNCGAG